MIQNNKQKIKFHNKKKIKKFRRSDYTQYAVYQGGGIPICELNQQPRTPAGRTPSLQDHQRRR